MNVRILSSKLQAKAIKEINEVPNRVPADLAHIKEWLSQQSHLNARSEDQWLLAFLRACKFSLHKTQERIDNYYTVRTGMPEFFSNRDPHLPEMQEILKLGMFLPIDNPQGTKIFLFRHRDSIRISLTQIVKVCLMIIDIIINEDDSCIINGQDILVDLNGITVNNLMQATPTVCKKLVICLKNSYPTRPKAFHIVNMPPYFENVLSIGKTLMGRKLSSRTHIYSKNGLYNLYNAIPHSVLPSNYGGNGESLEQLTEKWKKKVESYRDWFLRDSKYCTNESMRLKNTTTSSDLFGLEGSFRKLTID